MTEPEELQLLDRPRLRDGVAFVPVADEGVLYEEHAGTMHQLNAPASLVCARLDGAASLQDIAGDIAREVGEDPDRIARDVRVLVRELGARGVLDGVAAGARSGRVR
ncbi:MAG: PqqD family protein [Nitriliruptoraceae bacterium]|nr:PqqD family protein [Nitriliruptoraceae bacterium]